MNFEEKLKSADFSKETDLKERLSKRLFSMKDSSICFQTLSDEELDMVSAAGSINSMDKKNKKK
jgi:hypothetical protein